MTTTKTGKEVFMVLGVDQRGSVVWTESFDIQGVFFDEAQAQAYCNELNAPESDEEDPDERVEYEVYPLDVLKTE